MPYIKSLNFNKIWNFVVKQDDAALKGNIYELHRISGLISFGLGYTVGCSSSCWNLIAQASVYHEYHTLFIV
jgi:hypothetical protein